MKQVPLLGRAKVVFRDLAPPMRTKLVILVVLFVASIVAEREGYLVLGMPRENPSAIIILALFLRAVKLRMTTVIPQARAISRTSYFVSESLLGAVVVAMGARGGGMSDRTPDTEL
jgi:hypothetical protein